MQFIIKFFLICLWAFFSFHFFRIILTNEIDVKYPIKWIKSQVEKYIPTKDSNVNISPDKIILNTDSWKGASSFNIYNKTSETLYNIYIKLEIEGLGIRSEDIEVTPEKISTFMVVQINDISINYDLVRLSGTDSRGKEGIYLILYNLLPHESKSFKVSFKKTSNLNNNKSKILIKFMRDSEKPVQILSQDNRGAFPINMPENGFTIKKTTYSMKKNQ